MSHPDDKIQGYIVLHIVVIFIQTNSRLTKIPVALKSYLLSASIVLHSLM